MIYAGIGSRKTPPNIIDLMQIIGITFAYKGYTLHTGAAIGADQAFTEGAITGLGDVTLFLPWKSYEKEWINSLGKVKIKVLNDKEDKEAIQSVYEFHPNPRVLTRPVVFLHARNYLIVKDADLVICYSPGHGGTEQGLRIARSMNKPIYNLYNPEELRQIVKMIY